jgi:hypothetical protein
MVGTTYFVYGLMVDERRPLFSVFVLRLDLFIFSSDPNCLVFYLSLLFKAGVAAKPRRLVTVLEAFAF